MTTNVLRKALILSHPHVATLLDLERKLKPFSEQVARAGKTDNSHPTLSFSVGTGKRIASIEYGTQIDKPGPSESMTKGCPWIRIASMSFYLSRTRVPVLVPYEVGDESNDDSDLRARFSELSKLRLPIDNIQEVKTAMLAFMLAAMKPEKAAHFSTTWIIQNAMEKHDRQVAKKASPAGTEPRAH